MGTFVHAVQYIVDHWYGPNVSAGGSGVGYLSWQHIYISVLSTALAVAIALPVGLYVGHTRKGEFLAVNISNIGRALPAFGILGIVYILTLSLPGLGFFPTLITLVLLAIPPILTNTYVGVKNVDPDTVEAARGMGLSEREVLRKIELPLAMPVIVAGIRTSAVAVVATATLAAVFAWGGYGQLIFYGFSQGDNVMVTAGAIMVALLAIATEVLLALLERLVTPKRASDEVRIPLLSRFRNTSNSSASA
jgi:osmoprotectant transport system permease protein